MVYVKSDCYDLLREKHGFKRIVSNPHAKNALLRKQGSAFIVVYFEHFIPERYAGYGGEVCVYSPSKDFSHYEYSQTAAIEYIQDLQLAGIVKVDDIVGITGGIVRAAGITGFESDWKLSL